MSVIDDLVKKLKAAQRSEKVARQIYDTTEKEASRMRDELRQKAAIVVELECAISLLRNNLPQKPAQRDTEKVVPLKK